MSLKTLCCATNIFQSLPSKSSFLYTKLILRFDKLTEVEYEEQVGLWCHKLSLFICHSKFFFRIPLLFSETKVYKCDVFSADHTHILFYLCPIPLVKNPCHKDMWQWLIHYTSVKHCPLSEIHVTQDYGQGFLFLLSSPDNF